MITRNLRPADFADPFVRETLARLPGVEVETVLGARTEPTGDPVHSSPAGIIFHVSMCGSTLTSQMLKALGNVVVYSETPAVSDILMPPHLVDRDLSVRALRSLGSLLAHHAGGKYVLKMESWNVLFAELIQSAFPTTPWIFLFRDPIDVAVAVMADPDPPKWFKYFRALANPFSAYVLLDERAMREPGFYFSAFYCAFCTAALARPSSGRLILAYEYLPQAVPDLVARHFGLDVPCDARERLAAGARLYSKAPLGVHRVFTPDSERKRAQIPADIREAVDVAARPTFERLFQAATVMG